jgi:rhodanese-related sulfurtransferase
MDFVVRNWMLFVTLLLSGGMLVWPLVQRRLSPMQEIGTVNVTQLINRNNAVLVDVREQKEYADGHLPNAIHLPLSQLGTRGAEIAKYVKRPVVAYCERGQRSRGAGAALTKLGFTEVYHLTGGYKAWKDAGLPVEKA